MNGNQKHLDVFTGVFDEKNRQAFREHRLALGISLELMADFLDVHWSTIRKWEAGVTLSCHPRHVVKVAKFLSGEYDLQLKVILEHELELQIANRIPRAQKYNPMTTLPPSLEKELITNIISAVHITVDKWHLTHGNTRKP